MRQALRPYVTAGIALVGASLIAVTPVVPPLPNLQHRVLKLIDYTEYDASQLTSATEANWAGLESVLSSSNFTTDPDISQGLSTLFTDLSTGTSNAVTNPLSLVSEGALGLLSTDYAGNAASTALTAVADNIESALKGGNYSAALTDLENGPTTVLYAFLNGYPETVGSGGLISPEFGLLTNTADGAATGQIDALQQVSNTLADEIANLGGANLTTGSLPLISGNLDLSINLNQILGDLGLTSGGGALTLNGLLGDLGISPTNSVLPSSISLDQILGYLGINPSGSITPPSIDLNTILSDLGLTNGLSTTITPPSIDLNTILTDLGITNGLSTTITPPSIDLNTILTELGITNGLSSTISVPGVSLSSIITDLFPSVNLNGGISLTTLLGGLVNDCVTSVFGHCTLTVGGALNDAHIGGTQISYTSIFNDLGINTSATYTPPSISLDSILTDLGVISPTNTDPTISIPPISLDSILTDLGVISPTNTDPTISIPPISLDSILTDLGVISPTNTDPTINLPSISVDSILQDLGVITGSNTDPSIGLPSLSIDSILTALGVNPNEDIFSLLGISNPLTLSPTFDLSGGPVATYVDDLAKELMAVLGSSSTLSSDLPSLLGTDPTLNLEPLLASLLSDLGAPAAITGGDLSANLTNILAEVLPTLF